MTNKDAFQGLLSKFMTDRAKGKFDLQFFADGDGDGSTPEGTDPGEGNGEGEGGDGSTPGDDGTDPADVKKYSDKDVDKLLSEKFAKWQKQQEKKVSEAQKLASRNASKKSEDRIKDLEDKLNKYEREQAHTQMMSQARAILQDKKLNIPDALIENLVTDDADSTEEAINSFVDLFQTAVANEVKAKLKGKTPTKGSSNSTLTKEDIMKIKNPIERQKLIRENIQLFK